jgi:hypothetical protein
VYDYVDTHVLPSFTEILLSVASIVCVKRGQKKNEIRTHIYEACEYERKVESIKARKKKKGDKKK